MSYIFILTLNDLHTVLRFSGMWRGVDGYVVQDVSKESFAFLFLLSKSMNKDLESLKTKAVHFLDTPAIGYLWTQRHLPNTEVVVCTAVRN